MSLIHGILSRKLNMLLVRDRAYLETLKGLAGASLGIELTDLRFKAVLVFHHTYIEVLPDYAEPQLCLWGKSVDFVRFALVKVARQSMLQAKKIDFKGDLLLLEKIEALIPVFSQFNFDFFKKIVRQRVEYYQEEKVCLVSPILMQHFVNRLLQVQACLDRCELRLNCLIAPESSQ